MDFGLVCGGPQITLKGSFCWYVSFSEVCVLSVYEIKSGMCLLVRYVYGITCSMFLLVRPQKVYERELDKLEFRKS